MLCILFLVLAGGLLLFQWVSERSKNRADGSCRVYDRHYALIADGEDADFWDQVYESALAEGQGRNVYVERFGADLAVDYDRNRLMEMAIRALVDGIIVTGDEEEETVELINRAVEAGIPVVTVLQDCSGSLRQCYVGNSSYEVGQEYGEQILKLYTDDTRHISVLVDENSMDVSPNLLLLGIRETLEKGIGPEAAARVESIAVDSHRSFSPEEAIRDLFLDSEKMPDILVCLNAVYTRCAYQAAVDYNKVGSVQILGYYDSEAIVDAVSKNILHATLTMDTEQVGRYCVQALEEYVTTGYTNGYMAVDMRMIDAEEAQRMLEEE